MTNKPSPSAALAANANTDDDATTAADERRLGRRAALGIAAATIVGGVTMATFASAGPAILVLAGGTLLGTITLFWASVRTLTGDAPLALAFEDAEFTELPDAAAERKKMLLRALKDLERERAIGKIDQADLDDLGVSLRQEIKELMQSMDASLAPHMKEAERIANAHLAKLGGAVAEAKKSAEPAKDGASEPSAPVAAAAKRACPACDTENDTDATFCKRCGKNMLAESEGAPDEAQASVEAKRDEGSSDV